MGHVGRMYLTYPMEKARNSTPKLSHIVKATPKKKIPKAKPKMVGIAANAMTNYAEPQDQTVALNDVARDVHGFSSSLTMARMQLKAPRKSFASCKAVPGFVRVCRDWLLYAIISFCASPAPLIGTNSSRCFQLHSTTEHCFLDLSESIT